MSKKSKLLILLFILFTSSYLFSQQGNNKNVLLILVDDLNTDEASFGNSAVITPNMDKLSQQGIQFTNVQCSYPVCGPSRASFLTGTYPETNGVINLKTLLRDVSPDIVTLPQYLKHKGYITSGVGKVFDPRSIDDQHDGISWSVSYTNPNKYTYPPEYGSFVKGQYRVKADQSTEKGPNGVADDGYVDGQIALDAISKLNDFKNKSEPFFLSVGFKKPHLPFIAPKKYWDLYNINNITISDYQKLPAGTNAIAFSNSGEFKNYLDIIPYLDGNQGKDDNFTSTVSGFQQVLDETKQKEITLAYYAAVSYIDAQIGKVISALEENGQKENTIIILTSDHGFKLGDHNIWGKHNLLENSTQVPFVLIDPSKGNGVENRAIQLIDLFPTICELVDLPMLEQFQGNSAFSSANDPIFPMNLSVTFYRHEGKKGYSFKKDNFRYTLWTKQTPMTDKYADIEVFAEELYEYPTNDFHYIERTNLINDSAYQTKLSEIKIEVKKWWQAYNENHKNYSDIEGVLSVNENNTTNKLSILFPNPSEDYIQISLDIQDGSNIKIFDLQGRLIMQKSIENRNFNTLELDISDLKSGIYYLKIKTKTFKFIKN